MKVTISEKSKQAFEDAAKKIGITNALPDVSMLREDMGLYLTAVHMLATIVEAKKDGKVYDITNHRERKYEPWFRADHGFVPGGSSGGGFSFGDCDDGDVYSRVGARLRVDGSDKAIHMGKCMESYYKTYLLGK